MPIKPILVIDDDIGLTELLAECLQTEGFTSEAVHDGEAGIAKALLGSYSLLVLDIMLPGMSGLEVLMRIREQSRIPVLMLTARGDPVDRVTGLQLGADDYLPKPFNERELVARIRAILRRTHPPEHRAAPAPSTIFSVDDVTLDVGAREVRVHSQAAGTPIDLTTVEFEVLRVLMAAAGQPVTREDLVSGALGRPFSVFDRSIDNHVSSLRRKLGPGPGNTERIKTVRSVGYIYSSAHATLAAG